MDNYFTILIPPLPFYVIFCANSFYALYYVKYKIIRVTNLMATLLHFS